MTVARVYLFARDMMQAAAVHLAAAPDGPICQDAMLRARDSFIFAAGDLWEALRSGGHYHKVFEVDGHFIYLSDAQGPDRPFIMAVDSEGKRLCPNCYGAGVYRGCFGDDEFRPCPVCNTSGHIQVKVPACTRKELVHVD